MSKYEELMNKAKIAKSGSGDTVSVPVSQKVSSYPSTAVPQNSVKSKYEELMNKAKIAVGSQLTVSDRLKDTKESTDSLWDKVKSVFSSTGSRTTENLSKEQEKTWREKLAELDELNANSGYISTVEQSDEQEARRREIVSALDKIDADAGREARSYDASSHIGDYLEGVAKGIASSYPAAGGALLDIGYSSKSNAEKAIMDAGYEGWITDPLTEANIKAANEKSGTVPSGSTQREIDRLYGIADKLSSESEKQLAKESYGASKAGQLARDVGRTAIEMGADALTAPLFGTGLVNMGIRVFGQETQRARQNGDSINTAAAKGIKSAAIEVITEMLGGPFESIYGKSIAKRLLGKATGTVDRVFNSYIIQWILNTTEEGLEEGAADFLNTIVDYFAGWNESDRSFSGRIKSGGDASKIYDDIKNELEEGRDDRLYDMLVGAVLGAFGATGQNIQNRALDKQAKAIYGSSARALAEEGLSTPEKTLANTRAKDAIKRLNSGIELSGGEIRRMVEANTEAFRAIEDVIEKNGMSESAADLVRDGFSTGKASAETYARGVNEAYTYAKNGVSFEEAMSKGSFITELTEPQARHAYDIGAMSAGKTTAAQQKASQSVTEDVQSEAESNAETNIADNTPVEQTAAAPKAEADVEPTVEPARTNNNITGTEKGDIAGYASKFGEDAERVINSYGGAGEVSEAEYIQRFERTYQIGLSGQTLSRAEISDGNLLTPEQIMTAWELGDKARKERIAKRSERVSRASLSGKRNRKGTVSGENVSGAELRKTLNDPQNRAYRLLTYYAAASGIDIVLYKDDGETNGKFVWKDDKIYININSGVSNVKDLSQYTMLRTFAHEFTHFIEKWSPAQYNELRSFVWDVLERKGEDIDALIESQMKLDKSGKMTYEEASREVIADAMSDILPESDIVERLAMEHESIYKTILRKLKEFTAQLKAYFESIRKNSANTPAEVKAVSDGIKYAEGIVKLWTDAGVSAVRNYKAAAGKEVVERTALKAKNTAAQQVTGKKENPPVEPLSSATEVKTEEAGQVKSEPETKPVGRDYFPADDFTSQAEEAPRLRDMVKDAEKATVSEIIENAEAVNAEEPVPPKAETEKAKQEINREIRNSVKFPVETSNDEALSTALARKELSINNVTLPGNVAGFNKEQRAYIVKNLIEGFYSLNEDFYSGETKYFSTKGEIKLDIPFDGKLTVKNDPSNVLYILGKMGAKVTQEVEFSKSLLNVLKENKSYKRMDILHADGQSYVSNGYILLPISESAYNYAKDHERDGIEGFSVLDRAETKPKILSLEYSEVTEAPTELTFVVGNKRGTAYEFTTDDGNKVYFDKKYVSYLDSDTFYLSKDGYAIKTVDADGNVVGYALGLNPKSIKNIASATPSNLKAFSEKKTGKKVAEKKAAPKNVAKQPETVYSDSIAAWKNGTSSEKLAYMILTEHLKTGKGMPSKALYAMADKAFGGTQAQGAYNRKDAYDAMELAVNRYILDTMKEYNEGTAENAVKGIEAAQHILSLLPTQNVRTDEQEKFQQFSTPPSIAYIAAWAANITKTDHILEPSAGIGGIASFAKAWGATVTVNELSKRRLGILRSMGFDNVFNENAEQIDNVLPDSIQPTVVLMNPPFSATAGRTETNKTSNAERHIDQALERLSDGGRLVAIVGRGMSNDKYSKYWNRVRQRYNIRANIGVDGSNYTKYGTSFDIQIVVIDKTGAQGSAKTVTGSFKELSDIPKVLEGIRNDRNTEIKPVSNIAGTEKTAVEPVRKETVPSAMDSGNSGSSRNGVQNGSAELDNGQNGKRPLGSDTERAGGSKSNIQTTDTDRSGTVQQQRNNETDRDTAKASGESGRMGRSESTGSRGRASSDVRGKSLEQLTESEEASDDGIYATYTPPSLTIKGAGKHPATLVESAAMAAVDMPKATYVPALPEDVVKNNLSDAQVVSVVYAGQAHEQKLPSGERKGFFIGDGTGVGKGRQISGIILDNFMQGRNKAVWISEKADLVNDAQRDWTQTSGRSGKEVFVLNKTKLDDTVKEKNGILYTTYDTLKQKGKKDNISRVKQIAEWFGKDYDGVIVFDEAHNMGHLLSEGFGKKGSQKAAAGVELQKLLPNARVVYVSATAATEVEGLAFASRLGLWGKGTAFNDVHDFVAKIGSSGLSAMELVVRDMKAMGLYVARSISYNGVEYNTIQHDLSPEQNVIYDTLSRAWQSTLSAVNETLISTGGIRNSTARRNAAEYFSAMQRFYNQVLTSMSMPSVIADIRKQLAEGKSCVIQVVNTNQAQADRQIASIKESEGSLDELDLTPRDTLLNYIIKYFPVQEYEDYTDDNNNIQSRPVLDASGNPVINKAALKKREELIARVNDMAVPDGPFEMLFDAFGVDMVAEITGRKRRIIPKKMPNGRMQRVEESRSGDYKTADINAFQDGKKRILIFNDAGGTGKSYHADLRAKNQQQRVHYVLQPGWQASKAVQGFGRTHRSNEASAPIYKLVTTNIKGQKRFTSTIARRLDQLGALTKGQRDTGSGMFGALDNLETDLAKDALYTFYRNLQSGRIRGLDEESILRKLGLSKPDKTGGYESLKDEDMRDIPKFLNRILVLEVDEQNRVFDEFIGIYSTMMEDAIKAGTLDRGMENVKADKIEIIDSKVVNSQKSTGAETKYVQAKLFNKPVIIASPENISKRRFTKEFLGLFKRSDGSVRAVFRMPDKTTDRGTIEKRYLIQSPDLNVSSDFGQRNFDKLEKIPEEKWDTAWKEEIERLPEYNEHTIHMLTGTLLPIWSSLPQEGYAKVQRLIADNGDMYLGRVLTTNQIDTVLRRFDLQRTHEAVSASDVFDKVLKRGVTYYLTNNRAKLYRSRVSGEWRLEYYQPMNRWSIQSNYPDMLMEKIQYVDRYFIPQNDKGKALLEKLLNDNPVSSTSEDGEEVQYSRRRITSDMTDEERYNVLKDKTISITAKTDTSKLTEYQSKNGVSLSPVPRLTSSQRKKLFQKIGNEFNVFKEYSNKDIELSFNYSASGLRESLDKQGKNYSNFAKLLSCFENVVDSAIGIEVHNRNARGYKIDPTLNNVYVLVSAFEDGSSVIPVKLEVKEFSDKPNTLYVAIALESIKKDEVYVQGNTENGVTQYTRSSEIRLADLLSNVNPKDERFTKYIPEQFFKVRDRVQSQQGTENVNTENFGEDLTQYSRKRGRAWTNREILQAATDELLNGTVYNPFTKTERPKYKLTDGQKYALKLYNERLDQLAGLENARDLVREDYNAMFKKGGSRKEAAEAKNRLEILDKKVTAMENTLVTMEDKDVFKQLLNEARNVIEEREREEGKQSLTAYREKEAEKTRTKRYKAKVKAEVGKLMDMLGKPANKVVYKRLPATIRRTVFDFVSTLDFSGKKKHDTKENKRFMQRIKALEGAIKDNIELTGAYSGYNDLPPQFMREFELLISGFEKLADSSETYVVNQMNSDQLKELAEKLTNIRRYIQTMDTLHENAMFEHADQAAENSIQYMKPISRTVSKNGVVRDYFRRFLSWEYMRPSTAFERFGEGGVSICNEFKEGQSTQAFLIDKLLKFRKATYTTDEVKKWSEDTVTVELDEQDEDGERVKVTMPVAMAMSFYCLNRREQGRGHIYGDGITIAAYEKGGKTVRDEGHLITAEDAKRIENALTDRQIEVCKAIQRFMSTECSVWGNYVTMKRFGTEVFSEEFYFPINTDGRYLPAKADGTPSNAALYALLNMGFTKELQQGAKNRIMIYNIFDVFVNHASQMTQYRSFALPVLDCLKWLNFRDGETTLRGEMRKAYGAKADKAGSSNMGYAESFVVNLLKAYNGTTARGDNFDVRGIKALHRFNRAQVAFNLRVVIQQPMAITRAAMYINPAYLTEGLAHSAVGLKKLAEEMEAHSGIALLKRQGFYDTNISRGLEDLLKNGEETVRNPAKKEFWSGDNITDIGLKGAEFADRYTWAAMWYAAKKTVKRSEHKTEEEYFKAVTDVFENVIYKSQVVDSVMTKSEFLRSQSYFPRMMGAFMSEASATVSQLMEAVNRYGDDLARGKSSREAWQNNKDFFRKTFIVYGVGQVILAAVQSVADALRDDDDYETFLQKYLEALEKNVTNDLIPFSNLPYLSDLFELAKKLLNKAGFKNVYGYTNSEGWVQYGEYLCKSIEIFHGINTGDTRMKYTVWGGIYNLLRGVAGLTGYPIATLSREVIDAWNNVVGGFDASKKIKPYDPGDKNEIKYAYQDGYISKDKAVQKLVESGEADDKNDAYLTVHQWDTDSDSIYDAVFEAAENGDTAMFREERDFLTAHGKTVKDIQNSLKTRVRNSYLAGDYSASQAQSILSKFAGDSAEDARARMANWDFSENNPSLGWEYATIQTYLDEMKPAGISTKVYDRYLDGYKKCKGTDADGDGKTDNGSKKTEVLALIDSLDLTPEQKDVLYYKNNYAANKIYEAPWNK